MRPQYSIIFLTTMIGMAQGLLFSVSILNFRTDAISPDFLSSVIFPIAIILLIGGLVASFFHLGHPERAWRSAMMWRTSWLSREVIALPLVILFALIGLYFSLNNHTPQWLWISLMISCLILWICTAKIYQCIRFIQEWSHPTTLLNFFLLGLASGWLLLTALVNLFKQSIPSANNTFLIIVSLLMTFCAFNLKLWIWNRNRGLKPKSNLASATGIKGQNIRQTSMGLMGGSFNTREFFHHQTDRVIANIRKIILLCAYIVPMILMAYSLSASSPKIYLCLAVIIQFIGLICERWLFFAEANHPQNLYYQRVS
jgi:hypothetical protein